MIGKEQRNDAKSLIKLWGLSEWKSCAILSPESAWRVQENENLHSLELFFPLKFTKVKNLCSLSTWLQNVKILQNS